jgi:ATP-dependent DNA helicase RecG
MQLSGTVSEQIKPKNVGLLFFNSTPEKHFRYPQIEVVDKPDPTGEGMVEKIFKGPLDRQLEDALTFIKNYVIKEKIRKFPDRPEAERIFNYPVRAVEEALANAVYHKAYDAAEPITVTVTPDRMEITSIPGPDRSISDENMKNFKMISKQYRNRRIGNFLKELKMIEGRNTGVPTILRALENNGSPKPVFETDADRSYFTVVFPVHKDFLPAATAERETKARAGGSKRTAQEIKKLILEVLEDGEISTQNLVQVLGYSVMTRTLRTAIQDLIHAGKIAYTIPEQPNNRNQKLKKN